MTTGKEEYRFTRRHLPHLTVPDAVYFVTFNLAEGFFTADEQRLILEYIVAGERKFYSLAAVVVMPNHVHLLLSVLPGYSLSRIMKGVKGSIARMLNQRRSTSGSLWQDESYDRVMRGEQEFAETLNYMLNNPLKAGLTMDPWTYHGWWFNEKFFFPTTKESL